MLVLVTYDVATSTSAGRKRLRNVSRVCQDFGQRVQNSVFECKVDPAQWADLKAKLLDLYLPSEDSLRFYYLGANWERRVEHHGAKPAINLDGPLFA
jgi:CRISPR-associated protein Cas2